MAFGVVQRTVSMKGNDDFTVFQERSEEKSTQLGCRVGYLSRRENIKEGNMPKCSDVDEPSNFTFLGSTVDSSCVFQ